ncbi:MAG: tetratricopeptide repeat protein [Pyrinomonadaceae bacterium]|nr:tetratricopeptide repeat protein [Pyrinomonadaceae bacterium]
MYSRQYDKAVKEYGKVLAENPNFVPALFGQGMAYAQQGMFAEAIAAHEKAVEHSGKNPVLVGTLAGTRAMAGERDAALTTIEELKREYEKCEMLSYSIATVYVRLNEKQAAFEWLEKAYAERNSQLPDLDIDPEFDNLRDDSRFQDLRQRIGLLMV